MSNIVNGKREKQCVKINIMQCLSFYFINNVIANKPDLLSVRKSSIVLQDNSSLLSSSIYVAEKAHHTWSITVGVSLYAN